MTGWFRTICLLLVLALGAGLAGLAPPPASAQQAQQQPIDYELWEKTASRAEKALEAARASTSVFESLRAELVTWRAVFQRAQSANASTIETVRAQLEALGPKPEDGTEAQEIAAERANLNARLRELEAPAKQAELAYKRADAQIRAIDAIIRGRQADELVQLGPSPLNPVNWPDAIRALSRASEVLQSEAVSGWQNPRQKEEFRENLPLSALLLLVGAILLVRGRSWSRRLSMRVMDGPDSAARWMAAFLISLGSLVLPLGGLYAVIEAAFATGLVGLRTEALLLVLLRLAAVFLVARWLATQVFAAGDARRPQLQLDETNRRLGRFYGASLGLVISAYFLLRQMAETFAWSEASFNVIVFPAVLLASLLIWRLGGLLGRHTAAYVAQSGETNHRARATRLLARVLAALAAVAPLLAAAGYVKLAEYLLFPSALTLMVIAVLAVLQRLVVELYVLISGNREGVAESLVPVVLGFVLVLIALPGLALIWGARAADLDELWSQILAGFEVGGVRISPTVFLTFAVVFVAGYTVTRLVQGALRNSVLPKTRIDAGGQNAIVSGVGYVGIFLAAVIAITSAGLDLSSIAIVAGALSVGIGFGLQTIVSNFVSGIILLVERPISEGDWIEVGGVHGYVGKISVRATVIETFDRSDVIVPNSDLISGRVTNYTRGNTVGRVIVPVGVAYGTDTRKVETILKEIAEAHPMVLLSTPPAVVFQGFGADSLDFEIRAILRDVNWVLSVKSDMNHEIARRFAEEGIEIPFAQRDVWLRNPEVLRQPAAPPGDEGQGGTPPSRDTSAHLTSDDVEAAGDGAGDDGDADGGADAR